MAKKNSQLMRFWITCPDCKRKFGVGPKIVMKYIGRIIDTHKHRIDGIEEVLMSAQAQIEQEDGQQP